MVPPTRLKPLKPNLANSGLRSSPTPKPTDGSAPSNSEESS